MNAADKRFRAGWAAGRPLLLPLETIVVLLPAWWLGWRLATDLNAIEAMCLEATHYPPGRCAPAVVMLRGLLALLIPALSLVMLGAWTKFSRSGTAQRWRERVVASERALVADIRDAVRNAPRAHLLVVLVLTVLATALRAELINLPMRSDENQTFLLYSGTSLSDAVWRFDTTNNHILFSVLARWSIVLFGPSPWSARLPETVCGILLVPAAAFALRRGWGAAAALLTAAVIATLPYLIAFSTNARGYSVVAFCFLLCIPLAVRLLEGNDPAAWCLLVFLGALGMLANVTGIYPFGALFAWLAWRRFRARGVRVDAIADLLIAGGALGSVCWVLYGPALTAMGTHALFANPWMKPPPWSLFIDTLAVTLDGTAREVWSTWGWGIPRVLWIPGSALMLLAIVRDWRSPWPARGLLLAIVLWSALVAAGSHRVPYVRVFIPALPLFFVATFATAFDFLRGTWFWIPETSSRWAAAALVIALLMSLARGSARAVFYT